MKLLHMLHSITELFTGLFEVTCMTFLLIVLGSTQKHFLFSKY